MSKEAIGPQKPPIHSVCLKANPNTLKAIEGRAAICLGWRPSVTEVALAKERLAFMMSLRVMSGSKGVASHTIA